MNTGYAGIMALILVILFPLAANAMMVIMMAGLIRHIILDKDIFVAGVDRVTEITLLMQVKKYFSSIIFLICITLTFPVACFCKGEFFFESAGKGRPVISQEYIETLQKENPKLAEFEKQLFDIQTKVRQIVKDYQEGGMPKEAAKQKLIPLLKAQQEIVDSPEYLAESILSSNPSGNGK